MAAQSIRFDFLTSGADKLARDFKSTGDNAAAAARGAKVLQTTIEQLGQKENRTAAESATLAKALRLTGDAEDRAAAKALAADIAIRRLDDAMADSSKSADSARGGFAGLVGEVTGFGAASTAASGESSLFAKALAGVNLATGVLEPALAGVVVAVGGLAAGLASAGAALGAFGLVAGANLTAAGTAATKASTAQTAYTAAVAAANEKYKEQIGTATTGAQRQAAATARQNALQSAQAAQVRATTAAYAGLTPAQVALSKSIGGMQDRWQKFTASFAPQISSIVGTIQPLFGTALKYVGQLATAGGTAIQALLPSLGVALNSRGFKDFIGTLASNAGPAIVKLGVAIGHIAVGFGGILRAFLPFSQGLLTGLDKITAKFAAWGQTLGSHSGFQSLITTFKTETPLAIGVLKNLAAVLLNVGKAVTGLAGVGNSKALLQALLPLSGVLASLSKNTDLDRIVLYLIAARSAAVKLGPAFTGIKAAVAFFPAAWQAIVKFAAATEGATVAETIAAAATKAWGLAMDALPWVALAAAVVAVAVLIIKYHTQIWAFMKRVWNDILGVIMAAWTWVKTHWPLLLGVITGPVGLAILWIVQHFGAITGAVKSVLAAVSVAWNATWNTLKAAFRILVVDYILTPLGWIITGAARAFGWIPGLGGKLKTAAAAFTNFKNNVNKALGGVNGRTVHVSVAMTSSTNPYPGGISGRAAKGMYVSSGRAGVDDQLILAQRGEVVVPTAMVRAGAVDHLRGAIPGFAAGGQVGVNVQASAPGYSAIESSLMASVTRLAQAFAKAAAAVSVPSYKPGAGVQQWRGVVSSALSQAGSSQQLVDAVLYQMQTESGGNPTIVNKWDSNWLAGHPSVGLMQVIRGTFQAYAGRYRGTGPFEYGVSVNPLANVYSAIKYAQANYGPGLRNAYGGIGTGHGYDKGGWLMPGVTVAYNGTGRPEQVLPPPRGGSGGAPGVLRLEVGTTGHGTFDAFLLKWIQEHARIRGGGDVQAAFGRR